MTTLGRIGGLLFSDPAVVLYDGSCRLCRRSIRALRAIDLLDQIVPVDALDDEARKAAGVDRLDVRTLMQAMHVVSGQRVWVGFEACRMLAGRVPLLWPIFPLLYLWPVAPIGRRAYRWVASSRTCLPPQAGGSAAPPSGLR